MDAQRIDDNYKAFVAKTYSRGNNQISDLPDYELARARENHSYWVYGLRKRKSGFRGARLLSSESAKKATDLFCAIKSAEIASDMTLIENLALKDHADVKSRPEWQYIYHREERKLLFCKSPKDEAVPGQKLWSYPCAYCGLMLPEGLIQIDHRQPKAIPAVAVMKVLRAVGGQTYAEAPSSGQKATQINNLVTGTALKKLRVGKHAFRSAFNFASDTQDRYTLTVEGQTFLTLCCMVWTQQIFEHACVNNVVNLVPSCALCNGSSGKHDKLHQVPQRHAT